MVTERSLMVSGWVAILALIAGESYTSARAETVLRFSPLDLQIEPGQESSLSIHLDDTLSIRTIEIYVQYDSEILTSTGGAHGQCFSESGAYIFENWEETSPGFWHGYAIVMDALHWAVGPGELYVWSFTGDTSGLSPVSVDSLFLYAPDAYPIDEVSLPPTSVSVMGSVGLGDIPPNGLIPVTLSPNPFNPRTTIQFDTAVEGLVKILVFDSRGHNVSTAWSGWTDGGPLRVPWNAHDRNGRSLSNGLYLFQLEGPNGLYGVAKGMLLK